MPKNITIQTKNIPEILLEEINASENKAGALAELLNELIKLRYTDPQDELAFKEDDINELNGQVRALRLDLASAKGSVEGLQVVADSRKQEIEALQKSLHTKKEDMAMKIRLANVRDGEARNALTHALALINYIYKEEV